jgi:hypothetical protein
VPLPDSRVLLRRADRLFDQDRARLRYFNHLRDTNRYSPRSAADAKRAAAKTTLLQIRIEEKQRTGPP